MIEIYSLYKQDWNIFFWKNLRHGVKNRKGFRAATLHSKYPSLTLSQLKINIYIWLPNDLILPDPVVVVDCWSLEVYLRLWYQHGHNHSHEGTPKHQSSKIFFFKYLEYKNHIQWWTNTLKTDVHVVGTQENYFKTYMPVKQYMNLIKKYKEKTFYDSSVSLNIDIPFLILKPVQFPLQNVFHNLQIFSASLIQSGAWPWIGSSLYPSDECHGLYILELPGISSFCF